MSDPVADQVARADPERWRAAMTAPLEKRAGLMALYAFNLEIARAPWVTSEPMLAEIRLRWWTDAIAEIYDGAPPRRHEIVQPLAEAIQAANLPRPRFEAMIEARVQDIEGAPFHDRAALDAYLTATSVNLMELAARFLGAGEAAIPVIRDFAYGTGVAGFLRALPELEARGRDPLPEGTDRAALARDGLARMQSARNRRDRAQAPALPALLAGASASHRLRRASRGQSMEMSEFRTRAILIARAFTGRW